MTAVARLGAMVDAFFAWHRGESLQNINWMSIKMTKMATFFLRRTRSFMPQCTLICQARLQMPFVNLIPYNPTIAGVTNGYNTPR